MSEEIYVSVDVETDGPIPGEYSMLSIGAAAFDDTGRYLDGWTANLDTLPGAKQHPETMAWWATQPKAWAACRSNPAAPESAMMSMVAWLDALPGKPVFVAYPAGFDFTFTYWYLIRFVGRSPFGFQSLDLKTYAMARLGTSFRKTAKRTMPREWFGDEQHTHLALDDAIEQGRMFFRMREWKPGGQQQ